MMAFFMVIAMLTPYDGVAFDSEGFQTEASDQDPNDVALDVTSIDEPVDEVVENAGIWDFIKDNMAELILAFLAFIEVVVRLTPSEKDNAWFKWLQAVFDAFFPNLAKPNGTHN